MCAQQLNDVPASEVGEVVQEFVDGGSSDVQATAQGDGKWTVTAA